MKKLKKILLVNWLYFSKQIIDVDNINFLTGKNGAGKSTIIDALQIVLLGETNSRNFNQAANEKSQRKIEGYLRADMDDNNPYSRRGKDFTSIISCEFFDDVKGNHFVCGVAFDCQSDGNNPSHFFMYDGAIPDDGFVKNNIAMSYPSFKKRVEEDYKKVEFFDTQKQYRINALAKWNVHNEQVMHMMKRAVSFKPIVDIQKFITESICDIPQKPDIKAMQETISDYKRQERIANNQRERIKSLNEISSKYREMNNVYQLIKMQDFLCEWAKKEEHESEVDKLNLDKKEYEESLLKYKSLIEENERAISMETEKVNKLISIISSSSIENEYNKLNNEKNNLKSQREIIETNLNETISQIKQDALKICEFNKSINEYSYNFNCDFCIGESLDEVVSIYNGLENCNFSIFNKEESYFEYVQSTTDKFISKIRDISYDIKNILKELEENLRLKENTLSKLKENIKDYPRGLEELKENIKNYLELNFNEKIEVNILADVLEISQPNEKWRGAIEGYLNTQKFYLLVEPKYYDSALKYYNKIKKDYVDGSFGLVDIEKLREKEQITVSDNSLALKIETQNKLAKTYIDYLLGNVICCEDVSDIRNHKISITADGMLYHGYVARPIKRRLMNNAFIGQHSVALRMEVLKREIGETLESLKKQKNQYDLFAKYDSFRPIISKQFISEPLIIRRNQYIELIKIHTSIENINTEIGKLDLTWIESKKAEQKELENKIKKLKDEHDGLIKKDTETKTKLWTINEEKLPQAEENYRNSIEYVESRYTPNFIKEEGIPRYKNELKRLKKASVIYKNFQDSSLANRTKADKLKDKLFNLRRDYANRFAPCNFKIETLENEEYEKEKERLEQSELPQYEDKIRKAKENAMEQFQNDFIAKIKSSIDEVKDQVKSLNKALKQAQFGTDSYMFCIEKNPDYADYYDMIMSPELMDGGIGLFAMPFQEKYGSLIEKLFSQIVLTDEDSNSRRTMELEENIARYTDFRTYLKFDLETTDQNGSKQMLSKTLNMKSGGETQTPFYIAILASFAQLYQVNNITQDMNNTIRIVIFDEAFNKMDSERISESIKLLRKMGLQAIISTPTEKINEIGPLAENTWLVIKEKYQMSVLPYNKEIKSDN